MKYQLLRAAFEALSLSHLMGAVRALSPCRGVIFTLHRVLPERPADFSPNSILQVTPKFLNDAIVRTRELGFETVSMDEALERTKAEANADPFAVFTFDDAYRDNLVHALPVLRAQRCPFTLYVPTAFVDGVGEVWWQALEDIIAEKSAISVPGRDGEEILDTKSLNAKHKAFAVLYGAMRKMPEDRRVKMIRELGARYGLDLEAHCRTLIMDWTELQSVAHDPLCTIGAHTVHHYELSKLPIEQARAEIENASRVIEMQLGVRPKHFSYPIGSRVAAGKREYDLARQLGYSSAVTTIPGGLYARHTETSLALPRISLNGRFQSKRLMDVFLTGALFSILGWF